MKFVCILLTFFIFNACGTKKKAVNEPVVTPDKQIREVYPLAELKAFARSNDAYKLKNVVLKGNIMELEVTYSGGCSEHEFELIGETFVMAEEPPLRRVQLVHRANGDQCKALKTEVLKFSITPLALDYQKGKPIVLRFENYDKDINYTYN